MKNPQARKKRHARRPPKPKCWRCGSTRSLVIVNGEAGRLVSCQYHLPATNTPEGTE